MNVVATVLQSGLGPENPLVQLLGLVVAIGLVIVVGRVVLKVAWRLVTIAAVIIGLVLLASMFLPGLL
ncbi:hypothetical protein [Salinigranum marinum]|uniref:hypothetical protein n=1 Tax=Salinigranum marinum TaxID=1515595 RepID=UPI00298A0778|nr:hypothetical protein [Salinigranum marinum]